jgi:hypothetical protein
MSACLLGLSERLTLSLLFMIGGRALHRVQEQWIVNCVPEQICDLIFHVIDSQYFYCEQDEYGSVGYVLCVTYVQQ